MKLYLAGPMTGLPDFNYPEFRKVSEELRGVGYTVLNPAEVDDLHERERKRLSEPNTCLLCDNGEKHDWQWYMKRTIKMLCDAQGLAVLPGWEKSRGAKIEVWIAENINLPIASAETWLQRWTKLQKEWGK